MHAATPQASTSYDASSAAAAVPGQTDNSTSSEQTNQQAPSSAAPVPIAVPAVPPAPAPALAPAQAPALAGARLPLPPQQPPPMSSSSPGSSDDQASQARRRRWLWARSGDWEVHRARITELYRDRGLHLERVIEIMEREYGFHASPRMYKTRISKWSIDKNYKAADVACMLVIKKRRALEGKDTAFVLRGRRVDWSKIEQYLKRDSTLLRRLNAGDDLRDLVPNHIQKAGITCRTPSPEPQRQQPPAASPASEAQNQHSRQQQQQQQQHQLQQAQQAQQDFRLQQQYLQQLRQQQQHHLPAHAIVPSQSGAMPLPIVNPTGYPDSHHPRGSSMVATQYHPVLSSNGATAYSSYIPTTAAAAATAATTLTHQHHQPHQNTLGSTTMAMDQFGAFHYAPTMPGLNPPLLATTAPTVTSVPSPLSALSALSSLSSGAAANHSNTDSSNNGLADALVTLARSYGQAVLNEGIWYDETGRGQYVSPRTAHGRAHSLQCWAAALPGLLSMAAAGRRDSAWDRLVRSRSLLDNAFLEQYPLLLCVLLHSLYLAAAADADAANVAAPAEEAEAHASTGGRGLARMLSSLFYSSASSIHGPDHALVQLLALVDRALAEAPQPQRQWPPSSSRPLLPIEGPIVRAFAASVDSLAWVLAKNHPGAVDMGASHLSTRLAAVLRDSENAHPGGGSARVDANAVSTALLGALQGQQQRGGGGRDASLSPTAAPSSLPLSPSASGSTSPAPMLSPPTPPYGAQPSQSGQRVLRHLRHSQTTHTRLRLYHTYMLFLAEQTQLQQQQQRTGSGGSLGSAYDEFFVGADASAAYTTTPQTSASSAARMLPADAYGVYPGQPQHQHQPLLGHDMFYHTPTPSSSSSSSSAAAMLAMPMTPATTTSASMASVPAHTLSSALMPVADAATTPRTTPFAAGTGASGAGDPRSTHITHSTHSTHSSPHSGGGYAMQPSPHAHQHHLHPSVSMPTTGVSGGSSLLGWTGGSSGNAATAGSLSMQPLGPAGGGGGAGNGASGGGATLSLSGELEDVVNMENWV